MSFRTAVLTAIVAISAVTTTQSTSAQNYPTKPIHLEHFPSVLNRRDSQPLSPGRIWGN
jgi:hypothetical protein